MLYTQIEAEHFTSPYITAILILAIPFLILEYGAGYNFKSPFEKGITNINPKLQYFGWFLPIVIFTMTIYYSIIIGWDGIYVILSFFNGWGLNPNTFLTSNILQSNTNMTNITTFVPIVAISTIRCWLIVWYISHKNVSSGLSNVSQVFIPLMFLLMIIVGFSLTLPGADMGLRELFAPDWSLLGNFSIWLVAFGQIFFSLSLGIGAAFTFTSYTEDDADLVSSTIYVILSNSLFENFASWGVFSILGYMSLQAGVPVSEIVTLGTGLIFVAYPTVFNILRDYRIDIRAIILFYSICFQNHKHAFII